MKPLLHALCATALLVLVGVSNANAACVIPSARSTTGASARALPPKTANALAAAGQLSDDTSNSIVGLWFTTFYAGDGPDVWDQAYEQWHPDGTEVALDNGVPPALGNVCLGVWKADRKGVVHLRHFAFNWNPDGSKAGTFILQLTVRVDRSGKTFSGTYVAESYDLDGNVVPELHAEGVVRSVRLTVD